MGQRIRVNEVILSFPKVFTPEAFSEGDKEKYSATFVFPPEVQGQLKAIRAAALEVGREKFGSTFDEKVKKGKLHWPFREIDDDENAEKGYPEGSTFIRARSEKKPQIVSIYPDPSNGGKPAQITDEDEIYAGVVVNATLDVFAFEGKLNSGVTFGLGNLQKVRDGERLDGRLPATSEFEADADAAADLDDLDTDGGAAEPPKARKGKAAPAADDDGDDLSDLLG